MLQFKSYSFEIPGKGRYVVEGAIQKGEKVVLEGPTGCGKSTFLKSLVGITEIRSGHLILNDQDISKLEIQKRRVAYVPQESVFFNHLSVWRNVEIPLHHQEEFSSWSSDLKKKRVFSFLEELGLLELAERSPENLSGGEKQRLSVARALIYKPHYVLFDEPVSALDAATKLTFIEWMNQTLSSLSVPVLIVNHIAEDTFRLGQRKVLWPMGDTKCINF